MIIKDLLQRSGKTISSNLGISLPQAMRESRILLSHVTGLNLEYILAHQDEEVNKTSIDRFNGLVARRGLKEPIAYIVGTKEFYSRDFEVNNSVLIPRSDSETLIDAVLTEFHKKSKLKILELGVGSGCLILTLLCELPCAEGIGVDISPEALKVAMKNAENLNLEKRCIFSQSNWFSNVQGKYDIIICNPPYILEEERTLMAKETLEYEPPLALFGTFDDYQIIATTAKLFLTPAGKIYVEIGAGHEKTIKSIFLSKGYENLAEYKDLEGKIRIIRACTSPMLESKI